MRVLISGATGFIGRALAAHLISAGHEVVGLTREPRRAARVLPPRVRVVRWDARTAAGWEGEAAGADAIVNLAGENVMARRWTSERRRALVQTRLDAGRAVVEGVRSAAGRPVVVLQASGVCFYGRRVDRPVDESAPSGAGFLAEMARQWEASTVAVEALGARRITLRFGAVLGADGGALRRRALPFLLFVGGPIGKGEQFYPWIHVEDAVRAIYHLMERPDLAGPFNLVAPEAVRMSEFCRELGRALGRPSWLRIPPAIPRAVLGEMVDEALLCGQNARPDRLIASGFRFRHSDLRPALADLFRR